MCKELTREDIDRLSDLLKASDAAASLSDELIMNAGEWDDHDQAAWEDVENQATRLQRDLAWEMFKKAKALLAAAARGLEGAT